MHHDLRTRSAEGLQQIGFDGYAIGGLAVGEPEHERNAMLDHMHPILPADRPRYLMGVGARKTWWKAWRGGGHV